MCLALRNRLPWMEGAHASVWRVEWSRQGFNTDEWFRVLWFGELGDMLP